jgi:hypothetical protein
MKLHALGGLNVQLNPHERMSRSLKARVSFENKSMQAQVGGGALKSKTEVGTQVAGKNMQTSTDINQELKKKLDDSDSDGDEEMNDSYANGKKNHNVMNILKPDEKEKKKSAQDKMKKKKKKKSFNADEYDIMKLI